MSVETPELRAEKYSDKEREALAEKGIGYAMPDGSYPTDDREDVENAIRAVGRGADNSHAAIRRHIIAAAKRLGCSDLIPSDWNSDGTLAAGRAAAPPLARRKKERHRAVPLQPEVRFYHADNLEIREADKAGNLVSLHGMVIRYNAGYEVHDRYGSFVETMRQGVARDVIGGDTRFLFNHDGMPLARTASGTMTLEDSAEGLWVSPVLDIRQQLANDLVIAVERGDINQMSVGFLCGEDEWNATRDERTVKLFKSMPDVSAVTYPASPTTQLEVAQRMAAQMLAGTDSRARLRRVFMDVRNLEAELRAGKVLSAANAEAIGNAIKTLHGVYNASGLDVNDLMDDEPDDETPEVDDTDDVDVPDDGATDDDGAADDGAGDGAFRQDDPGEPVRDSAVDALRERRRSTLELQARASELRRRRIAA